MGTNLNFFTMNSGDDQNSYAKNSSPQRAGIMKAKPIVDEAIQDLCKKHFPNPNNKESECHLRIADLGCSSGPNTLLFISNAIDTILLQFSQQQQQKQHLLHQFEFFLNDLPQNDFNNLFKLLPNFYQNLYFNLDQQQIPIPIQCYIHGSPGTYYGRLFPNKSMHFIHSSYSLHRLSQVPDGLGMNDNKGDIYISTKTPFNVIEAYSNQYRKDFTVFLKWRSEEVISGGKMVILIVCRGEKDHGAKDPCFQLTMVSTSLLDLAAQGLVKEEDIDAFNVPFYLPHGEEIKSVIESEGSFEVNKLEVIQVNWGNYNEDEFNNNNNNNKEEEKKARIAAGTVRAFMEPLLINHFGKSIIDPLFERYVENVKKKMMIRKSEGHIIFDFIGVVSLTRK